MYPWVDYTHSLLRGECPHHCGYCYVQAMAKRFPNMKARYSGPVKIMPEEFQHGYPVGKTVFIEHLNDLFAKDVPRELIVSVLDHCSCYPDTTFVFQTKNPQRFLELSCLLPRTAILGTTIESNSYYQVMRDAPTPDERIRAFNLLDHCHKRFITIEPILDFDLDIFAAWFTHVRPDFVNIGADSKGHGLPEPSAGKIRLLIKKLTEAGIEIREKHNLGRLLQ